MKPVILLVCLARCSVTNYIPLYTWLRNPWDFWLNKNVAGYEVLLFSPTKKFGTREIIALHFCLSTILYNAKIFTETVFCWTVNNEKGINGYFRLFITNNLCRKMNVNKVLIGRFYVIYICLNKQPLLPP